MKINLDKVPGTLYEAVQLIVENMTAEDIDFVKNQSHYSIHFSFGRWQRNNWSLWDRETNLVQWFIKTYGIGHADDISGLINGAVWALVRNEPFDIEGEVARYKNHWAGYGVDAITGEKIV